MTHRLYAMDTHFMGDNQGPTPAEQAALVKAAGYDDYYVTGAVHKPEKFDALRQAAHDAGLGINAAFECFEILKPPTPTDLDHIEHVLSALPDDGRLEIALTAGGMAKDSSQTDHDDAALTWLEPIAQLLENYSREGSLYPHFHFYVETLSDAIRLADTVGHPQLKVMFTSYHWFFARHNLSHAEPDYAELFAQAGDRLNAVNLCGSTVFANEQEAAGRMNPSIDPLDTGDKDIDGIVAELQRINFQGPIGIQGYAVTDTAESALRRSFTKLKSLLG
ncbi:MAG: TIM barrel protein [Planctomycetota bacterium]